MGESGSEDKNSTFPEGARAERRGMSVGGCVYVLKKNMDRDFPGSPVVKTALPLQGVRV